MTSTIEEKLRNADADFRYMGLNDLNAQLASNTPGVRDELDSRLLGLVLECLQDSHGEVQNMAIKRFSFSLAAVVKSGASEQQLKRIEEKLFSFLRQTPPSNLQDIAALALKTVVTSLPANAQTSGASAVRLIPQLFSLQKNLSQEGVLDTLEILVEIVTRFGGALLSFADESLTGLLAKELLLLVHNSPRITIKKRAAQALGIAAAYFSNELFEQTMDSVWKPLMQGGANGDMELLKISLSSLTVISRQCSHRMAANLAAKLPVILGLAETPDEEIMESCLQVLEVWTQKCPQQVSPSVPAITNLCLTSLKYDPNYAGEEDGASETTSDADNDDMDDTVDEMEQDQDNEEDEEELDYSDDEDMSWKVRRAAAKTLQAVILAFPEWLSQFYRSIAPALLKRSTEREDGVRVEVLSTLAVLLQQTASHADTSALTPPTAAPVESSNGRKKRKSPKSAAVEMDVDETPLQILAQQVQDICKSLRKALKEYPKHQLTRQMVSQLLAAVVATLKGGLNAEQFGMFLPFLRDTLATGSKSPTSNRMDALKFLHVCVTNLPATVLQPQQEPITKILAGCICDEYFKVVVESLSVVHAWLSLFPNLPASQFQSLYFAVLEVANKQEGDLEVKEASMDCLAQLVVTMPSAVEQDLAPVILPLLLERLKSEVTRLSALKAFVRLAKSPDVSLQAGGILVVEQVIPLLRKNHRALRLLVLEFLVDIFPRVGLQVPELQVLSLVAELKALLNDSDLHILALSLQLFACLLKESPARATIYSQVISEMLSLLDSVLLYSSNAMDGILQVTAGILIADESQWKDLLQALLSKSGNPFNSLMVIAQVVATVMETSASAKTSTLKLLLNAIGSNAKESDQQLAFLILGELGRRGEDFTKKQLSGVQEQAIATILKETASEDVRNAASLGLGWMTIGNVQHFLPVLVEQLRSTQVNTRAHQLFLNSLLHVISGGSKELLRSYAGDLWNLLVQECDQQPADQTKSDGTRVLISECLGQLASSDLDVFLPELDQAVQSASPFTRCSAISAVRFLLSEQAGKSEQEIYQLLRPMLLRMLASSGSDQDITVRLVALSTLNATFHSRSKWVGEDLQQILPILYQQTQVRQELISVVDMGPFKHTIDKGLDVRKTAFECLGTLLEVREWNVRLDWAAMMVQIVAALVDPAKEIQSLGHWMLVKCVSVSLAIPQLTQAKMLDELADALRTTLFFKLKESAVKQEIERQNELVRSGLRALLVVALACNALVVSNLDSEGSTQQGEVTIRPTVSTKWNALLQEALAPASPLVSVARVLLADMGQHGAPKNV